LTDGSEVLDCKFPSRLHSLSATSGEEHSVEVARRELGESTSETRRRFSGVTPEREVGKLFGLSTCGFSELGATMPNVDGEQATEAIEELSSCGVVHVCALATFNNGQSIALSSSESGEVAPDMSSR
jgi:hypothetical protein